MFMQHNVAPWQEPPNLMFEPSPVWLDDGGMAVDEVAKVFLRNVLSKSKGQLGELKEEFDRKRREVDAIKRIRQNIRAGKDNRDEVELVKAMFSVQEDLHHTERKRLTAEVEANTIITTVGDLSKGAQNHNFKSQTFKIPTNCDLCGDRIWGLSAKGFDCRDCGYTCHSKCELKVPAACPGELSKDERKKTKIERQQGFSAPHLHSNGDHPDGVSELPALSRSNTMNSLSSGYAASANRSVSGLSIRPPPDEIGTERGASQPSIGKPQGVRKNRILAPPPAQYISEMPAHDQFDGLSSVTSSPRAQRGKMLFPYQATNEGELSVSEGDELTIIEPDGTRPPLPPLKFLFLFHLSCPSSFKPRIADLTPCTPDGSGWITVRSASRSTGLVPASYLEYIPFSFPSISRDRENERPDSTYSSSSTSLAGSGTIPGGGGGGLKKKGPAVAPKRGARKLEHVEALYAYEARSDAEWSMTEGERFVLVNRDAGDGWADVERGGISKSVPANYIRDV